MNTELLSDLSIAILLTVWGAILLFCGLEAVRWYRRGR